MNTEPQDRLDGLLNDWSNSRQANTAHTRRLSEQILVAARSQTRQAAIEDEPDAVTSNVGRNKSSQFRLEPYAGPLPEPRKALFRPTASRDADWAGKLMLGGGGLLLLLVLTGGLLYYNLETAPNNGEQQPGGFAASPGRTQPPTAVTSDPPVAALLDATVLAAKQRLLAATNDVFDNQLAWITEGPRDVALEVRDRTEANGDEFVFVRVVVAQRASPDSPWSTTWQADVISRNEALVEIAPKQLDGSSLALWTYLMPDGEVAVDMDLMLDQETQLHSSSSTVLQTGRPTRVGCATENGVEQCVFQTVIPLRPASI